MNQTYTTYEEMEKSVRDRYESDVQFRQLVDCLTQLAGLPRIESLTDFDGLPTLLVDGNSDGLYLQFFANHTEDDLSFLKLRDKECRLLNLEDTPFYEDEKGNRREWVIEMEGHPIDPQVGDGSYEDPEIYKKNYEKEKPAYNRLWEIEERLKALGVRCSADVLESGESRMKLCSYGRYRENFDYLGFIFHLTT